MAKNELYIRMEHGEKDAIIKGLISKVAIDRVNAIRYSVRNAYIDPAIVNLIRELKNDESDVWGTNTNYPNYAYAIAALDILGIEKYDGDHEGIRRLIQSKMEF